MELSDAIRFNASTRDICWNCNLKCVNRVVLSKLLAKLHELGPIRASLRMIYDLDV